MRRKIEVEVIEGYVTSDPYEDNAYNCHFETVDKTLNWLESHLENRFRQIYYNKLFDEEASVAFIKNYVQKVSYLKNEIGEYVEWTERKRLIDNDIMLFINNERFVKWVIEGNEKNKKSIEKVKKEEQERKYQQYLSLKSEFGKGEQK